LNNKHRLRKNEEFQEVFKRGQSYANRQFVLYLLKKKNQSDFRLGLSVSKKIGNAVTRNKVKRYIKEVITLLEKEINDSYDYIVIARKPTASMDFFETKKSLIHVLSLAKVIRGIDRG
jgi:ribonuclease P protein component